MHQPRIRVERVIVIEGPKSWVELTLSKSIKPGIRNDWGGGYVEEVSRQETTVTSIVETTPEREPFAEVKNG